MDKIEELQQEVESLKAEVERLKKEAVDYMTYEEYIHSELPEKEAADAKAHYEKPFSRRKHCHEVLPCPMLARAERAEADLLAARPLLEAAEYLRQARDGHYATSVEQQFVSKEELAVLKAAYAAKGDANER